MQEKELSDYIKEPISIIPLFCLEETGDSCYNIENKKLTINLIDGFDVDGFDRLSDTNKVLLYNFGVTLTILHELDHASFTKSIDVGKNEIDVIFANVMNNDVPEPKLTSLSKDELRCLTGSELRKLCYEFITSAFRIYNRMFKYDFNYHHFHNKDPYERRANINSNLYLSQVLDILYDTSLPNNDLNQIRLIRLKEFIKNCRYGYIRKINGITNSPSCDFIKAVQSKKELFNINIYDKNSMTFYNNAKNVYTLQERILYGLPLSVNELRQINKDSNPFHAYEKIR